MRAAEVTTGDGSQSGQVAIFVIGLTFVVFAVTGIAIDGTRAFLHRRTLQNVADAAAQAAAARIDLDTFYSGDPSWGVDGSTARSTVGETLGLRGIDPDVSVSVRNRTVTVVLHDKIGTTFLGLVGVRTLPVAVEGVARPVELP